MSERTFDDFDQHAANYRKIHSDNVQLSGADSFYFARMKIELLTRYEKNDPVKVLDIGCGDGTTEIYMRQFFPNWKVTGIDISEKSIEAALKLNLPAVFSVYNGSHIPFDDDTFDCLFIAGVLHHVAFELHETLLNEMYRVLKKGGRIYLFEHNPLNPVTKYLVKTCVFDDDAKLLYSSYTAGMLKKSRFKNLLKNFILFLPRKGLLSKLIFLEKYLQWLPLGGQYFFRAEK